MRPERLEILGDRPAGKGARPRTDGTPGRGLQAVRHHVEVLQRPDRRDDLARTTTLTRMPAWSPSYVHGQSNTGLLGETIGQCFDRIVSRFPTTTRSSRVIRNSASR